MKLWDKGKELDKKIEKFTIGKDQELDLKLAPYDVLGSIAHIKMLKEIGIVDQNELKKLEEELKLIYHQIEQGDFEIEPGIEDVHSQVELMLTRKLGEYGKKIHSGRSRNDQVLVDLRLFFRQKISEIVKLTHQLGHTLIESGDRYKGFLMPGYTHFQVAMPSSFGLWFSAYAESLSDDLLLMHAAYQVINQNPLGSAAGYGTSFPLNRKMTTGLLGFDDLNYNVVYAQMGRGKTEKILATAMAFVAATLSKMAYDICLYNSQNFGFISFPDHLTTGSSIMPHKKNPDVFELIRGKCNQIQALPTEIMLETNNLPSGYHRDFQVVKENLFPAIEALKDCLEIMDQSIQQVEVKPDLLKDGRYQYIFSVEEVNKEVLKGVPFREAYQKIGKQIEEGTYKENHQVSHTHEGSIGNLCLDEIRRKLDQAYDKYNFVYFQEKLRQLISR